MALNLINLMTAVLMQENKMAVQTIQAHDDLGGSISYSVSGGADANKFSIDAVTGALTFVSPPDFDVPGDANADNVYEVEVTASSTSASSDVTQALTVTISAANDALEKSLDLARVAGDKIAEEKTRNDDQDERLDSLDGTVATKADQATVDTLSNTVATKASQTDLDTANTSISQNSNRVGELEGFFDGNDVIKLDHLPEQLRTGMKPLGTFAVATDELPAATASNEFQYYIVDDFGQVDLSAAQDGSQVVDVAPKGWIISTGDTGWRYLPGGDGLTTVNGKTAQNGAVTIKAEDTPYAPSAASGLTATTAKAGLDEAGVKIAEVKASLGDTSTYDPVATFNRAYDARVAQG